MNLELKNDVRKALDAGADHVGLLNIIHKYKDNGVGQRETYDTLHSLWKDFGYDDDDGGEDPTRDELEYVMELVWGFCAPGRSVWGRTLENNLN